MPLEDSLKQEIEALQLKLELYESEIQKFATLNNNLSMKCSHPSQLQAKLEEVEAYEQQLEEISPDAQKKHLYRMITSLNQEHDCLTQIIQDSENAIGRTIAVVQRWQKEQQPEYDGLIVPIQTKILRDLQRLVKLKAQLCAVSSEWAMANNQLLILD